MCLSHVAFSLGEFRFLGWETLLQLLQRSTTFGHTVGCVSCVLDAKFIGQCCHLLFLSLGLVVCLFFDLVQKRLGPIEKLRSDVS